MINQTVKVALIDGKTMADMTELPKSGQPLRIKAVANGKYVLTEGDKGFAPEMITVKRVGKDLHVALEGSDPDQPQLIIEGFFDQQGQLVGMAEDGNYYEFITADAEQDHGAAFLIEDVASPQVLGGESLSGMEGLGAATSGIGWVGAGLIGAGLVGAGLALGSGGGGGSNDDHSGSGTAPATPNLGGVHDNVGDETGLIENGGVTDDATPTFSGQGTPGNVVVVKDGDEVIGEVVVGEDGRWEFTPPVPLPDGSHEIVIVEKDSAGNESAPSEGFEIIIDLTAPGKSVIGDVQDNVGVEQGHVAQNERTDDNTPTLTGTAEAGSTVEVYNQGVKIGETIANPDGTWAFTPDVALPDGHYEFSTVAVDEAGNRGLPSDPYSVIIDTSIVSILQVVDDQGTVTGEMVSGGVSDDTTPTLSGKAIPNATVNLYDNGVLLGSTTSDALGNWTFNPTTALVEGDHSFTATVVQEGGIESAPTTAFDLEVDLTAPVLPVLPDGSTGGIDVVTDNAGSTTGPIVDGGSTDDATPTLGGGGLEPGDKVTIIDGGQPIGEVIVDENGDWTYTPDPLGEGKHDFSIIVTDPAGNSSNESDPYTVIVDTTAPLQPVIISVYDDQGNLPGNLNSGDTTDDAQLDISGTAEPGSTVSIFDGITKLGEAQVDASGNWTFTPPAPLLDGSHSLTVVAEDAAGNVSQPSDQFDFTLIPGGAPVAPVITDLFDDVGTPVTLNSGDVTNDTRPTINGTGAPGSTITVFANGVVQGTTIVQADGSWSFDQPTDLPEGSITYTATETNAAGNVSADSNQYSVTVDITGPLLPGGGTGGIDSVIDDNGAAPEPVFDGGTTDDNTPTLGGGGLVPGDKVTIIDNGGAIGEVVVDASGNWTFTPPAPLPEGNHDFTIVVTDPAGNASNQSDPYTVVIDTTAPAQPVITTVYDDQGNLPGNLTSGDTTDDAQPEISGTAEPGSTVSIFDGITKLGEAQVDASGNWTFTPPAPLLDGSHSLTVVAEDAAGNVSQPSDPFDFTLIPGGGPVPPVITDIADDVGTVQVPLNSGDSTDDPRPTINGTGVAGTTITVYANGVVQGTTVVQADGSWSFDQPTDLQDGPVDFTATATDAAGNVSAPTPVYAVVIDTTAPTQPVITSVYDDQGNLPGNLNSGDTTDDAQLDISGTAEPGSTVSIFDGITKLGEAQVDASGNWTFTPPAPLLDGSHSLTVVAEDAAGNVSQPSDQFDFTLIPGGAPVAPVITDLFDDVGTPVTLNSGDVTNDTRPTINGTGVAGSTITVSANGAVQGTTIVQADGTWSFDQPTDLAEGPVTYTATETNAAGNVSADSNVYSVIVDITGPLLPGGGTGGIDTVIDDNGATPEPVLDGGITDDNTPTLGGGGLVPGDKVTIIDNGGAIGEVVVDASGNWTFTPPAPLPEGNHDFTIVVTDPAGNASNESDPYTVIIDTSAPAQPIITSVYDDQGNLPGNLTSGDTTDDAQPEISGTAEPGSTVSIFDGITKLGEAQVDASGNWTFTPPAPLLDGSHSLTVVAEDAAGNVSQPSDPFDFTLIPGGGPVPPVITDIADDVGIVQVPLNSGDSTDDTRPTINGTGVAGTTITVYANGVVQGTTVVQADGSWSFDQPTDLLEGPVSYTATATDAAGNVGAASSVYTVFIDLTAPVLPGGGTVGIDTVIDDNGATPEIVNDGGLTNDNTPTIEGVGLVPGDKVTVKDNNIAIGEVVVDASGNWTFTPPAPLPEGNHDFTIVVTDPAGNASDESDTYTVIIDTSVPLAEAVVTSMGKDSGSDSGDFVTGDGTAGRLIQGTLTATLAADEKVQVSLDGGATWEDAVLNGDGTWSFVDETAHTADWAIQTRVVDGAGNIGIENSEAVTLDTSPPNAPLSFKIENDSVEVVFDSSALVAGDTLLLMVDNQQYTHVLNETEIATGVATIAAPGATNTNVSVGVMDQAGNVSDSIMAGRVTENFEIDVDIPPGGSKKFNGFTLNHMDSGIMHWYDYMGDGGYSIGGSDGQGLATLDFDVPPTSTKITLHGADASNSSIHYYDSDGVLLYIQPVAVGLTTTTYEYTAPAGSEIGSVRIYVSDPVGISLTAVEFDGFATAPPLAQQTIDQAMSYIGGDDENVFTLADTSLLDSPVSGIHGNGGLDTLKLSGANQILDLTNIGEKMSSIEVIDLTGSGANTLKLSLDDVLNNGETDLFHASGKTQMTINGDADDVVDLQGLVSAEDPGAWIDQGAITVGGVNYNVYSHSSLDAELLVQDGVTTNLV